ncbi:thiamine phosphate synthase [Geochorda subterranea]|uniref:Thiamine-phosphate synthase n=1 Tax=Geochorda subterranea TaxID=3109564 RepID=A0ABZ1BRQ6_9FIRM|nr:thiamine phosphate synthase [Limnochorda sp. LNt]WRP15492.1 thiamine phosphate synthase [Limnochorda sp. LNt]
MSRRVMDLSVYVVTDRDLARGRPLDSVVAAAIAGGATAIQLREKRATTRELVELAQALRRLTHQAGVSLIVNDRIDVALAVDADGVHVGQDDMPARLARQLIGPERILGVTAGTEEEARRAQEDGADYLGCTAVFPTATKPDHREPLGLDGLQRLARAVSIPVVAIGGIHAGNAADVLARGAAGIAVVSAVMAADDVESATRQLRRIVDEVTTHGAGRRSRP